MLTAHQGTGVSLRADVPGGQRDQQRLADWMETEANKKTALSSSQGRHGQMPDADTKTNLACRQ